MKRFVILGALAALGAATAILYSFMPQKTVTVGLFPTEDGGMELKPIVDTVPETLPESENAPVEETQAVKVSFSLPATFYSENISVELSTDSGAEIYFTTDGSDPVVSEQSRYTAPIDINAGIDVRATTIKAVAVKDGETSDIFTRSYVTGQDVDARFSEDTLVFVLSTDPYNLYDYEYGIAVPGKIYDDYVKEHAGQEIPYNAPGNYFMTGKEWERPIYVEVFESSGANVISQSAGVKLVGGYSRVPDQKSLKLIARKSYGSEDGKFKYSFFPDAVNNDGFPISEYDRIVLRNGANDREFAGVRDELSQQLARDYGFATTQHTVPAAVFLNGEYYGFSWLHENYNEDYLATQFGGNKEQYEIVENTEYPEDGSERALADYAKVVEFYEKDMTDDKVFEEFCELVDIDNLMQYYCIQVFISNKDWPGNNYKAYRYYPEEGEEITSEYMDGRWRYLLFDAEFAWGLYGDGYKLRTLSDLLSGKHMSGQSDMLISLLAREDMQEKFANTMCDLMADAFSTPNILETLENLIEVSDPEQMYALDLGIVSTWARREHFAQSRDQIREFAEKRSVIVLRDMATNFDTVNVLYDVSVTGASGAEASLNTLQTVGGVVSASYFRSNSVPVSAEIFDGYEFVAWEVNGERIETPEFRVTYDMADEYGRVSVRLITEKKELHGEPLRISEICTDKNAGWLKLSNPNADAVSTKGLFLTDDETNLTRYALPEVTLSAGETLIIMMKNNKTTDALMQHQATFSLKAGETLILSDADGNILGSVPIPEIAEGGIYTLRENGKYLVK